MNTSSEHIANLNQTLKSTKSDLTIDFIYINYQSLIITSNRVMSLSDISIISQYISKIATI